MSQVTLRNIWKKYPGEKGADVIAVRDFNLEIADREFVVFVGPSGCGKSTTLRMIAGLEEISEGDIHIGERRVNDVPPKDRDIAMVFQNYALYPHMSVFENMAFGLKLRRLPKKEIRQRVNDAATILGITPYLQRKPKALSGGQRQRVAVGRAIVRQPQVFLFDEPLSNLDAKMRVQMRGEITKLHQNLQATMIYVTHDQVEAMTMGTRIVVMKDGVIQQADTPLKLYRHPVNLFVAGFLGSPPMNFLQGTLRSKGGRVFFHEGEGGSVVLELAARDGWEDFMERAVTLGIRSEHCDIILPNTAAPADSFEAAVELVEPMGAETFFYLHTGAHMLACRTQAEVDHRESGYRIRCRIDASRAHLFDPVSGKRLP